MKFVTMLRSVVCKDLLAKNLGLANSLFHPRRLIFKWKDDNRFVGSSYYIIPEIPKDVASTNGLLDPTCLPRLPALKADDVFRGISKLIIEFEANLSELKKNTKDKSYSRTFEAVVSQLEALSHPLDSALQITECMPLFDFNIPLRMIVNRLHRKVYVAVAEQLHSSPDLYRALVEVNKTSQLDDADKGLLQSYLTTFEVKGGAALTTSQQDQLHYEMRRLMEEQDYVQMHVTGTARRFESRLVDPADMALSTPAWLRREMAVEEGGGGQERPLVINVKDETIYKSFMKHCTHRQLREQVWVGYVAHAGQRGVGSGRQESNDLRIAEIRHYRQAIASILGHPSWAHLVCARQQRLATSVEVIGTLLEDHAKVHRDRGVEELALLTEWARKNLAFKGDLRPWDMPYMLEQYEFHELGSSHWSIDRCLDLSQSVSGLLDLAGQLFGVKFVRVGRDEAEEVLGRLVGEEKAGGLSLYRVFDTASVPGQSSEQRTLLGELVLDLLDRPGKFHTNSPVTLAIRHRSQVTGLPPISCILSSLPSPAHSGAADTRLTRMELVELTGCLGSVLQQLLTTVGHHAVAGQQGLPCDASQICADLLTSLVMATPQLTAAVHPNWRPDLATTRKSQSPKVILSLPILWDLYLAAFDVRMWTTSQYWRTAQSELWNQYLPYPADPRDQWPCSNVTLFGVRGLPLSYYVQLWRPVVGADVFNAFAEAGLKEWIPGQPFPSKLRAVCDRFRSTFLSLGSSVPAIDVFRRFRGRDPILKVASQST